MAAGRRPPGGRAADRPARHRGALPDGTPVIVTVGGYGDGDSTLRVRRLADGTPVGEPLTGHDGMVTAVAVGALPDGTPVIVSGSGYPSSQLMAPPHGPGTVRVQRLADGTPVGEPLTGHRGAVTVVAGGRCRTAPRSSSAAAATATARCGCGGWPTASRPGSR